MTSVVDVYILEDHKKARELLELNLDLLKTITFRTGTCQYDLTCFLQEGNKAKLYMIDGNYPERVNGQVSFMVPYAVSEIRKKDPEAKIILHSNLLPEKLREEASKLGIDCRFKECARGDVRYISQKLEEITMASGR